MTLKFLTTVISALAFLLAGASAFAQKSPDTDIRAVITRQLDAMKKGDEAAAFAIASPMIQQMFQTPRTFMSMVESGYPQVLKSRNVRFLALAEVEGRLMQRVVIESDAGTVIGNYEMVQIDGTWRINGCMFEKRGDA